MGTNHKVVVLPGGHLPCEEDADIVQVCKDMLEMAEKGELACVAVAYKTKDKYFKSGSAGQCGDLLNALDIAHHDLMVGFRGK